MRRDFETFDAFASSTLDQIYPQQQLDAAYHVQINTLDSGVLLNEGDGRFVFRPLPGLAQLSPGFGVVLAPIDGDATLDLTLLQNHYTPQRETTRMAAGVGAVLLGDGHGSFRAAWPSDSGFVVPGDGKALALVVAPDGRQTLLAAQNDDALLAFDLRAQGPALAVRLHGPAGNPHAVGARVTLVTQAGHRDTAEVYAGEGYLTQNQPMARFGSSPQDPPTHALVRWPDGETTRFDLPRGAGPIIDLHDPR